MVAGEISAAPIGEVTVGEDMSNSNNISPPPSEAFICLKVKDVLGLTPVDSLQRFVYPAETTFQTLFTDVAERFKMDIGDFDLTYQERMDLYELSAMPLEVCLTAANLLPSKSKEYSITISTRSKKNRRKYLESISKNLEASFDTAAAASPDRGGGGSDATEIDPGIDDITDRPRKREFVGLKNTTMTCYLNSLTQGLYFTPSFRNLILSHVVDPDPRKRRKSIVFPLQKIFLQLQFSSRDAIETDELTRTFGWTDRDTWQQHDIQELCSVLMEMLNNEFKATPQDGIINNLYFGSLTDYVKCLECNNFRHKPEEFLVLPLPIRKPNRQSLDLPTLEEALKTFTTPELLDGNNQYRCEKCAKPCDAHKGYLFKTLPSIFSLQLKRFDSDFETNRRYKLNDQIIFPVALDMSPYMDTSNQESQPNEEQQANNASSAVNMQLLKPTVDADGPRMSHSRPGVELTLSEEDQHEHGRLSPNVENVLDEVDVGSSKDAVVKKLREMKAKGGANNVYELFAVFVHRGGLAGGHYFAYIKDFETYRWYRCDDSSVRPAREEDIKATFGDVKDTDQTSAYMLMYQRYDEENVLPFLKSQLPTHVLDTWETLLEHDQKAKNDDTLEKNTFRITVKYKPYKCWETRSEELVVLKSLNTKQVAHFAFKSFFPDVPNPPSDHIRVCRYDMDLGVIENSFDDEEQYLSYSLKHPPPKAKNEGLILEVKNEGDVFPVYQADDLVFVTLLTDGALERVEKWEEFHAGSNSTVGDLRKNIALKWKFEIGRLVLGLQAKGDSVRLLDNDSAPLSDLVCGRINRLFAESLAVPEQVQAWIEFVTSFVHVLDYVVQVQRLPAENPASPGEPAAQTPVSGGRFSSLEGIDVRIVVPNEPIIAKSPASPGNVSSISTESCSGSATTESCTDSEPSLSPASQDVTGSPEHVEMKSVLDQQPQPPSLQNGIDPGPTNSSGVKLRENAGSSTVMTITSPAAGSGATENEWIPFTVNLDSRASISTLSRGMSEVLSMSESLYSFFYFNKDNDEVEVTDYSKAVKDYAAQGGTLRIRFCQRLQEHEGRVGVFLLNLNNLPSCGNYLGDAILHPNMTMDQAKQAVLTQCYSALGGTLRPEKCRLRRKLPSERISKVFRDGIPVNEWISRIHEAEVYLQIYEEDSATYPAMDRDTFSVSTRRWHGQDWILEPPSELTVYHDHSCEVSELMFTTLSERSHIPLDSIELARVEAPFPYTLNPLAIQELDWFSLSSSPTKKPLYLYNDELVLFIRDGSVPSRLCTVAEENEYRSTNDATIYGSGSSPRREIGIRINLNLSKTPESVVSISP